MLVITPIPALHDNYIWLILHPDSQHVLVVDPGEAGPVIEHLQENHYKLSGILLTHHHWDHTDGVPALLHHTSVPVYGPASIEGVTHPVCENDLVQFENPSCQFKVLEIPGHTLDHIAYVGENLIFCGDTLFTGGCGRVFEGTADQMFRSLSKLATLPPEYAVYCAHEYTEANLRFAKMIEPNNTALLKRIESVTKMRSKEEPTVPAPLSLELATNPFLRCDQAAVIQAASQHAQKELSTPVTVFTEIRGWKSSL